MNNSYKWLHISYEALDVLPVNDVIRSDPRGHAEKKKIWQNFMTIYGTHQENFE